LFEILTPIMIIDLRVSRCQLEWRRQYAVSPQRSGLLSIPSFVGGERDRPYCPCSGRGPAVSAGEPTGLVPGVRGIRTIP
jgi:hypothetical protein